MDITRTILKKQTTLPIVHTMLNTSHVWQSLSTVHLILVSYAYTGSGHKGALLADNFFTYVCATSDEGCFCLHTTLLTCRSVGLRVSVSVCLWIFIWLPSGTTFWLVFQHLFLAVVRLIPASEGPSSWGACLAQWPIGPQGSCCKQPFHETSCLL